MTTPTADDSWLHVALLAWKNGDLSMVDLKQHIKAHQPQPDMHRVQDGCIYWDAKEQLWKRFEGVTQPTQPVACVKHGTITCSACVPSAVAGDDEIAQIIEGVYRWTIDTINRGPLKDQPILGTGNAPLLKPSEAEQAIRTKYISRKRAAKATELLTIPLACYEHEWCARCRNRKQFNKGVMHVRRELGLEEQPNV